MTSALDCVMAIKLVKEATDAGAREEMACKELGISQRTLQRWRDCDAPNEDQRPIVERPTPKNKLSDQEAKAVINTVNQLRFQSLPPSQIVPILADEGVYLASESTFYRIMKDYKMQHHRGRSRKPTNKPLSTHCATGPNQVWMWDITWLPGPAKGIYFYLYLILDLFSRKIIAWDIWLEESSENASVLVRRWVLSEQRFLSSEPLVLHSDNGSPMKWVLEFVRWYNLQHRHSGINYLTPHQRHSGMGEEVLEKRQRVYQKARAAHPERWTGQARNWSLENEVWLNPETEKETKSQEKQTS